MVKSSEFQLGGLADLKIGATASLETQGKFRSLRNKKFENRTTGGIALAWECRGG